MIALAEKQLTQCISRCCVFLIRLERFLNQLRASRKVVCPLLLALCVVFAGIYCFQSKQKLCGPLIWVLNDRGQVGMLER